MYSVYDVKAEAYLQPFYMENKNVAIRAFEATVNDEQSNLKGS